MNNPIPTFFSQTSQTSFINEHAISPLFFRISQEEGEKALEQLFKDVPHIAVFDTVHNQLKELLKLRQPGIRYTDSELEEEVKKHLGEMPEWAYGVWVYYPWNGKLVHVLDKEEFAEVRTNRNLLKITPEERKILATKRIGVIGLSVGQSVALTLAMERSFGELRIGDFDTLELSNMNRIRTGIFNLGLPKTVIVAREIAEIDPFLKVTCYHDGVTAGNMDDFLHKNGKLDVLIDECDSLNIKLLCRRKARASGIPVVMDTSDRGMIDIERFDNEPEREILHGLVEGIDRLDLESLNQGERVHLSLQIAGGDSLSERMKASIPQIGKTISTWPQLASSVALGGAVTTQVCNLILLNKPARSGRFYVDIDRLIE